MKDNDDGLVTVAQFAARLGKTPARVRQLVDEGKLPQPKRPGTKAAVWPEPVVRAVLAAQDGGVSVHSALAPTAPRPLRRVFDGVIEFEPYPQRQASSAHVRIWEPAEPDGVTVVVLGALTGTGGVSTRAEAIAETVRDQLLGPDTDPERVAWLEYWPAGSGHGVQDEVISVTFRLGKPERRRFGLFRAPRTEAVVPLRGPSWYPCGVPELERIVGGPVECYPKPAYIPSVIEAWQRSGQIVDYEHDRYGVHAMLSKARVLDATPPPAEASSLADALCHVLVTEAEEFLGDLPIGPLDEDVAAGQVWAARIVPTRLTVPEQELVGRHRQHDVPGYLPADSADVVGLEPLLAAARNWMDQAGPDGDNHTPELHEALEGAVGILALRMRHADPDFEVRDLPEVQPRLFDVIGPRDKAYLEQVRWNAQAGSTLRRNRIRRKVASDKSLPVRYGLDPSGHLVAYLEDHPYYNHPQLAVEWPTLKPPIERLDDDVVLVADGDLNDRPVYLLHGTGQLQPLPETPTPFAGGWNFGYGGSGPGLLIRAISELVKASDHLTDDQVPRDWITDQVHHSSKESLAISLADLRRRIRKATELAGEHGQGAPR
ncbi:helix-turn-helix transcriptional regulator [Kribbella sp. NPDC051587]|uniref:helix-turn-helix transcriptional regulator n=1 Tax=Kribbella sp. NPDC051587 TaxID=3364119 RepID=UPI0037AD021A